MRRILHVPITLKTIYQMSHFSLLSIVFNVFGTREKRRMKQAWSQSLIYPILFIGLCKSTVITNVLYSFLKTPLFSVVISPVLNHMIDCKVEYPEKNKEINFKRNMLCLAVSVRASLPSHKSVCFITRAWDFLSARTGLCVTNYSNHTLYFFLVSIRTVQSWITAKR